jgi:tetratricopeptide (TPR) repeat protein
VHALNAVLLYLIGRRLSERWTDGRGGAALAAALLFALHPAQTEAVAYISGRSASLMASFYLGALLVYLRGGSRLACAALFAAAAAVKETAATLPVALLLCEACSPPWPGWKTVARRQAAPWLLLPVGALAVLLSPRYRDLLCYGFTQRGAFDNLLAQIGGLSYLLARLVTLRGFNIDPALPEFSGWTPALAAKAAALAALFLLGPASLRRRPWLAFGVLWFFLQLAPTNSFVPRLDVANDRQLYLACWGLFLAASVEVARLKPPRLPATAAAGAVLAAFAAAGVARQFDYASEIRLWESSVRLSPSNPRARNNLGNAYQEAGRRDEARAAYREALRLRPDYQKARVNLRLLDWDETAKPETPALRSASSR